MSGHINATAGRRQQLLHQLYVNLRVMDMHEGEGHQIPASKVLTDEAVDGFSIFESTQQSRKSIGLIVQREHCLVNNRKSGAARLSQRPRLGDPILEYGQLLSF
jgi:hypothetical protein